MTLTRRWASGSADDLEAGIAWYNERQPGLGEEFAAEVFASADRAMHRPMVFKRYEHTTLSTQVEFRKAQLRRFSEYGVIFTVVGDTFWILAIAHAKRRPGYWADRLNQLG